MNKILLFILGTLILIVGGVLLFSVWLNQEKQGDGEPYEIPAELAEIFQNELIARGVERQGQPIEGFDAFLLLQAFPGLQEQDFDGVLTFEGMYSYENGELRYGRTAGMPVTSAEQTVSSEGYEVLLQNLSKRLGVNVQDEQVVLDLIYTLEGTPPDGEPITVNGEITCLSKIGPGAQTLECAIGLKGEDGNHYALQNIFDLDPDYQFSRTGLHVEVVGTFLAEEMFGPDGNKYDIAGTIEITSIKETNPVANECNVEPDENGQCPAGCVNYGMPLGCVTQEYYDQCQTGEIPCPL